MHISNAKAPVKMVLRKTAFLRIIDLHDAVSEVSYPVSFART